MKERLLNFDGNGNEKGERGRGSFQNNNVSALNIDLILAAFIQFSFSSYHDSINFQYDGFVLLGGKRLKLKPESMKLVCLF